MLHEQTLQAWLDGPGLSCGVPVVHTLAGPTRRILMEGLDRAICKNGHFAARRLIRPFIDNVPPIDRPVVRVDWYDWSYWYDYPVNP
jgi:hypothetical protein